MKRLLVLLTVVMLTASAVGCNGCLDWLRLRRGDQCPPIGAPVVVDQCCGDPCGTPVGGCSSCGPVMPGPVQNGYAPGS